ncbi:DNA internalization-related competence protein ComEC/Rec2 [Pseudomonas azotifigens]|uniref:DNA internalization-related competence protein ComEC/Rec2 n=2 Tax=Stutzerimonas azotifigens TaxID=291995 RepID=A0ABR5YXR9_9GAMM|nr:DNA internalization-related competence protein ComEC/Rec2 [Stutzerimonas azotifigens]
MLALAAGLVLLRFLPTLPPLWGVIALLSAGLLLAWPRLRLLGLLCIGFGWACLNAHWAMNDRLPASLDGRTFWLEGTVVGLPAVESRVVRFELEQIDSRHAGLPSRLRLAWYGGPSIQAGERWRVAATLKRPHGLINPQSFDYEAWLLARRIGATGTIKAGHRLQAAQGVRSVRDALRSRLMCVDAFGREGALAALVVGDSSGLTAGDWRVLQDTGTVHLMVISGQHVGMLAGLLYGAVALLSRFGLWPRRLPWLPWACGLALGGALGYAWLAGFDVPVRRACLMVAAVLLWRLRYRQLGVWMPLLCAFLVVLVLEPLAVLQPGLWLSFGAVALLAWVFRGRLGAWSGWQTLLRAQWSMALGLVPLMMALGLPVSLTAPLANLIAVPGVSLLVVPTALLGSLLLPLPWIGEGLLWLAGGLLSLLFTFLGWVSTLQPAWLLPAIPLWGWILVALGTLVSLLPTGVPLRPLGLVLLLPLFYPSPQSPAEGRAQVWMFDVGQGNALLIRTRGHALLYDAGPRFGDFDLGERVVGASLRKLGIQHLDTMLLSHADSDHAGGALAVRRMVPVARVLSGEPQRLPRTLKSEQCTAGEHWEWDGVRFTTWLWAGARNGNQASCVLLVEANGERLLLTGDIDVAAERALLRSGFDVQARWLLVPHHGSRSSSSPAFVEAVAPQAALLSRGLHNNFGHPHPSVVQRFDAIGVSLLDTAKMGAVRFELGDWSGAEGLRAERRFWREK